MNRNRKNYLLYILIILLISIGYAITQSNLMINGTGKIASTKFDVYFENLTVKDGSVIVNETAGDKAAEILENNTQKVEYSITLKEPGEFYEFEVYAVNNGSTDVKIQTILSKINNEVINNNIPSYLDYSVLYEDGTPVSVDDVLQAGTSTKMKVKIEFKTDINPDELPDSDIDLNFSFEITYIQTDEVVSTLATYRVIHKRMNLNGTAYDIEETEEFEGNIGDQVTPSTKSYTGFTSPSTTTTTLDSSSVKTIEYLYDRNKYNLTVTDDIYVDEGDLSGEYYYETPITLTAKNRSGYGFDRWSDGTETNPISFTISENTTLQPLYYPEGKVAEMDGVYYDSVTAALAQVPNNTQKTIRLLTNTTEAVTVAANKDVILNLRSYEINNTTSKVITNKGKLVINNGTLSCTKTNVISNENDMVINGTTINCSADSGAINNEADSNLTVTDATVTATGKRQAIYNNGGVLYVNGDTHLSNKSDRGALHNLNSGTVYLESGTITSTSAIGAIYNQSGTVNIGKKDGRVTNVTPEIIGNNGIAIKTETGTTLNFYDGIVKSTNNLIDSTSDLTTISNKINEIEEDSEIIRENDSTYKKFYIRLIGETYTVILNPNGGTVDPENVTVLEGTEIGLLPTPEKELHDFVGWYTGIDTGILIESSYIPQGDMEIFARWNKKPTYTIKFETDTNTTLDDKEILQGNPIGSIEAITKTGMFFDGWYLENTFNTKVNEYYVPESNITLYAKWITTTFPKVFEQTGICDFNGTISGSECQKYNGKTYIDTKVSLYNEINIDKDYEIHFEIESYDPSENESQATFFNTKQEATGYPGVVVRKGNNNANQIELASRKTSSANESYNINYGNITTLSVFRINNVIYYSLNGADKVELNNLTQYNPTFDLTVWFGAAPTDGTATSARRFLTGKLKNMYIKLGTYVEEGKYRIDYDVNGGNPITPSYKNVVQGEKIGALPTPTYDDWHTFDGWYTAATNGTLVDSNYVPESNMPIYAHWRDSNKYTVTFNKNDENATGEMDDQTIIENKKTALNENQYILDGYGFIGWNTESDGTGTSYLDKGDITLSQNTILYAQWVKKYTLTFDKNNENATGDIYTMSLISGISTRIADEAFSVYKLKDKMIGNYNTKFDYTGISYYKSQNITITKDTTLYAYWKDVEVTETIYWALQDNRTKLVISDSEVTGDKSGSFAGDTEFTNCNFNNVPWVASYYTSDENLSYNVIKVEVQGLVVPTSTACWFNGVGYNATTFDMDLDDLNTSKVTDMSYMFGSAGYNAETLTLDLSGWNNSKVTDMSYMFSSAGFNATTLTLDLSGWDNSNVTTMEYMFYYAGYKATTFTLNVDNWNTTNLRNMYGMFIGAGYSSNSFILIGLDTWETSKVTNMSNMFGKYHSSLCKPISAGYNAETFDIGNLTKWDTKNVTNMSDLFYYAGYNATTLDIGDLSSWDTSKVTDMHGMFESAGEKATNFALDLSKWDTSNVTNMSKMFSHAGRNATTWTVGDLSKWKTSNVTDMTNMFEGVGGNVTNFALDLSKWDTSKVTDMSYMFNSAGFNADTFDIGGLSEWKTSSLLETFAMFRNAGHNATTWNIGDLSSWNTSKVTSMRGMFNGAGYKADTFDIGDISEWDTSKVNDMTDMFNSAGHNATTWNIGDLSSWNTSKVTRMEFMFYDAAYKATTFDLDLSSWNTSKVTSMGFMFNNAGSNATTWSITIPKTNGDGISNDTTHMYGSTTSIYGSPYDGRLFTLAE